MLAIIMLSCNSKNDKSATTKTDKQNEAKATNKYTEEEVADMAAETSYTKEQITTAATLIKDADQKAIAKMDAKKLFKNYCAICHGIRGNMEINGSKDLSKSNTTLTERVAQIYYGKGTMPPQKAILNNNEIIAVAKYIDDLKG